jgi:hypothetical protein
MVFDVCGVEPLGSTATALVVSLHNDNNTYMEDDKRMDLRVGRCVEWIHLAQDRDLSAGCCEHGNELLG